MVTESGASTALRRLLDCGVVVVVRCCFSDPTWRDRHSHRTTSCICQIMVAPIEQASVASSRGRPYLRS